MLAPPLPRVRNIVFVCMRRSSSPLTATCEKTIEPVICSGGDEEMLKWRAYTVIFLCLLVANGQRPFPPPPPPPPPPTGRWNWMSFIPTTTTVVHPRVLCLTDQLVCRKWDHESRLWGNGRPSTWFCLSKRVPLLVWSFLQLWWALVYVLMPQ